MRHDIIQDIFKKRKLGFTLVELMVTLAILGVLAGISIPTAKVYMLKAEYAALQSIMRFLMDGEDLHFAENDKFYPETGIINIPKGAVKDIPELAYTFPQGHKHRYIIYGLNREIGEWKYNYYYIMVYSDFDFNNNGYNDVFIAITYIRNGEIIYNRKIYQYR